MKQNGWNALLLAGAVVPLVLLLWPFAWWGSVMQLVLRVVSAVCVQLLVCRLPVPTVVKGLPLVLTGAAAGWGCWLYFTSPAWSNATVAGLAADYLSPAISCALTLVLWLAFRHTAGKRRRTDEQ